MEIKELVSVSAAARILGVSIPTLRNWDANGKLKPIRTFGNHRRYKVKKLMELIKEDDAFWDL